ncbi:hypothetical protein [Pseudomonas tohonis]|uniref:hypothetical protein n=1 Tax=Pseudomonas tohonis TaxID=2725477 RepID=UPI00255C03EC|nr:hypothetical protein [Pseudomonas tohonis]
MWSNIKAWLVDKLQQLLDWGMELLEWFPKKLFSVVMDGLASFLEAIPVPDFIATAGSFFGGIHPGIAYVCTLLAVNEGIAMMIAALTLRFILRRIPLIG